MKKSYPKGEVLASKLASLLKDQPGIELLSTDNPVHFTVQGKDCYVFMKCVSYAGSPYPQNTTRAQLPCRPIFDKIKDGPAIVMLWGYDMDNDVYVAWDPIKVKSRLNKKSYVSFFSRKNIQESVVEGKVSTGFLNNDDKYVLFKATDLALFLKNMSDYFPKVIEDDKPQTKPSEPVYIQPQYKQEKGKLAKVEDDVSIKLLIDNKRSINPETSILNIVVECINEYGDFYDKMTLYDWYLVVKTYIEANVNGDYPATESLQSYDYAIKCVASPGNAMEFKENTEYVSSDELHLHLDKRGVHAECKFNGKFYVVLKGSEITKDTTPSYKDKEEERNKLMQGNVCDGGNHWILIRDMFFNSPSTAGSFCIGAACNGWTTWFAKDDKTLDQALRH